MPTQRLLDDASVEAILEGRLVPSELDALASAVGVLRETARLPVQPSRELAEFMATGGSGVIRRQQWIPRHRVSSKLAGMSLRIKLAVGIAAGLSGLTGAAAAAGEMPEVQASVETAVETAVEKVEVVVAKAADGVEAAVDFVTPNERVASKGIVDPVKVDDLSGPIGVAGPPPDADGDALPEPVVSPLPSASAMPEVSPEPQPVVVPTAEPTPSPTPAATPVPEPTPTPTPPPTPEETPTEPPPPPDPADAPQAADADPAPDPALDPATTTDLEEASSTDQAATSQ